MLVLVSLALLLWCRKKRRRLPPSAAFGKLEHGPAAKEHAYLRGVL
jgi:hypothetical protein